MPVKDGELFIVTPIQSNKYWRKDEQIPASSVVGEGDVVGPASSTDNAIVRFDGTTGKLIQDYTSGAPTVSDTGAVNIPLATGNSLVVDTTTLVVDATNNRVGIGTASPGYLFDVKGSTNGELTAASFDNTSAGSNAYVQFVLGDRAADEHGAIVVAGLNYSALPGILSVVAGNNLTGGMNLQVNANASLKLLTQNTTRWLVNGSGHFLTGADNTYDIGASGATRPRTGYFGTSVISPVLNASATSNAIIVGGTPTTTLGLIHATISGTQPMIAWEGAGANQGYLTGGGQAFASNALTSSTVLTTQGARSLHLAVGEDALLGITVLATSGNVGIGTTNPIGKLDIVTSAGDDDPTLSFRQARVATTDATVTTLQTIAVAANTTYLLEARVVARRTGGTAGTADDGAVYIRRAMVTTKAGTVTINAVQDGLTQEDQAGWDCTFTVSGTNVLLRITGAVDNNVTWHTTTLVQLLSI